MSLRDEPHFRIASSELAAWLEAQGVDRWWNVDGDPLLNGRVSFPSPGDELAAELRRINRVLLVQDRRKHPSGHGEQIVAQDLDGLVTRIKDYLPSNGTRSPWENDRIFFLSWEGHGDEWMLIEDGQTTERELEEALESGTRQ